MLTLASLLLKNVSFWDQTFFWKIKLAFRSQDIWMACWLRDSLTPPGQNLPILYGDLFSQCLIWGKIDKVVSWLPCFYVQTLMRFSKFSDCNFDRMTPTCVRLRWTYLILVWEHSLGRVSIRKNWTLNKQFSTIHIASSISLMLPRIEVFGWIFVRNAVNAVKHISPHFSSFLTKVHRKIHAFLTKIHRINFYGKLM